MRILITGVTGMTGSHLAEYLIDIEGLEVYGTYRCVAEWITSISLEKLAG